MNSNNQDDTKTEAVAVEDVTPSTIRFPTELWKRAKIMAVRKDCAASDLVIAALRGYVAELESQHDAA